MIRQRPLQAENRSAQERPLQAESRATENQPVLPPVQPINAAARAKIEQRLNNLFQQNRVNDSINSSRSIFHESIKQKALFDAIQDETSKDNFEYYKRDAEGKQEIHKRTERRYLFDVRKDDEKAKEKLDNDNKSIFKLGG